MTQSTNSSMNARAASKARREALSKTGKAASGHQPSQTASKPVATTAAPRARSANYQSANGNATVAPGKAASIARRLAMSSRGKAGIKTTDRTRDIAEVRAASAAESSVAKAEGCGCGCGGKKVECKQAMVSSQSTNHSNTQVPNKNARRQGVKMSAGRAASFARRVAMSKRGKAAIGSNGLSAAQTARAANPDLSSRELAQTLREQRSRSGKRGEKKSEPCGRVRPNSRKDNGSAQDAPWKVGATETTHGQTMTGTMVGPKSSVTGDESGLCRDITGTEYMGADIFRNFCQQEAQPTTRKVVVTTTAVGNSVSGNKIGRSENVTGNEMGNCTSVTGDQYMSVEENKAFCGKETLATETKVSLTETAKSNIMSGSNVDRLEKVTGGEHGSSLHLTGSQYTQPSDRQAPAKVQTSTTLRGGTVSGTVMVDRSEKVSGNEAGTCRNVTGDDYLGQEQFNAFCSDMPVRSDNKVERSSTTKGNAVTGVMTSRSERVTGNEPGTCKAVTGTPYASVEQAAEFCSADQTANIMAMNRMPPRKAGAEISGMQPSVGGVMTGDDKGMCENISGTPYIGSDQVSRECSAEAATPVSADFPQAIQASGSSIPEQPQAIAAAVATTAVTGSSYGKGNITGPFGMANGKVTGTEQARSDNQAASTARMLPGMAAMQKPEQAVQEGRPTSRISGEGIDGGKKITGNDWDRGEHVTGTEGTSAIQRNPTIQPNSANKNFSVMQAPKRNDDIPAPVSKVTGSSGNTGQGSLVTYSGGARG